MNYSTFDLENDDSGITLRDWIEKKVMNAAFDGTPHGELSVDIWRAADAIGVDIVSIYEEFAE